MADADNAAARQPRIEQSVQRCFASLVERGGCFVHEQPIGLLQQSACDRHALLCPARELLRQVALRKCLGQNRTGEIPPSGIVGGLVETCALWEPD